MMRFYIVVCISTLLLLQVEAQVISFADYSNYLESAIQDRRFKQKDIQSLVLQLPDSLFEVNLEGHSVEGREIYLVKVGQGDTKVLLWSQMHGNEPTATMAIMDIFNFLQHDTSPARNKILDKLTLYFIPMLNPDGAEIFERRNALEIDINRDALRLQSPESRILKGVRDRINPEWGFNLHDQNPYSSAGKTKETASISFLAPAYNVAKDWNPGRTRAMQLICLMNEILQKHIPNQVGRYSDEFEPRAFGDNIQKWGTNTILIETGARRGDPEKQYLRKMNYLAILEGLYAIGQRDYERFRLPDYNKIPLNGGVLHDLVIRNALVPLYDSTYMLDIGFRSTEVENDSVTAFYGRSYISDVGDLHTYFGHEEFDAEGYDVRFGHAYAQPFKDLETLSKQDIYGLMQAGYNTFRLLNIPRKNVEYQLPFAVIPAEQIAASTPLKLGQNPILSFAKDGKAKHILVNGKIVDLEKDKEIVKNWFDNIDRNF